MLTFIQWAESMYPDSEQPWRTLVGQANTVDIQQYRLWEIIQKLQKIAPNDPLFQEIQNKLQGIGKQLEGWILAKRQEVRQVSGQDHADWYRSSKFPS